MQIHWYPGHMAKARRMLTEQLRNIDIVIELCDARLPGGSRNPDLDALVGNRARLLVLNKADLANKAITKEWVHYYRHQGIQTLPYVASRAKGGKELLAAVDNLMKDTIERKAARGIQKTVRAMVVGIPNVGKSTLTNGLYGSAAAKVGNRPGVTRGRQWVKVSPYLEFLDTPGLLWPKLEDEQAARHLAYIGTIRDEILDNQALAASFLKEAAQIAPNAVKERFKLECLDGDGYLLLETACRKRGWIRGGAEADMDRGASVVLEEFRSGRIAAISLERPPMQKGDKELADEAAQTEPRPETARVRKVDTE